MIVVEFVFWLSVTSLVYNYVGFPILMKLLSIGKKQNEVCFTKEDNLPMVSVLLAAYNEESVIEEKIKSTFKTNYPLAKLELMIGSDASTDGTDDIIKKYKRLFPNVKFKRFGGRTGKPTIIDDLKKHASGELLIMTDANVFFDHDTVFQLVKHFKNQKIGLVGGNILNVDVKNDGISKQEKQYLSIENKIKYQEGVLWGTVIGAFGGAFAIRKSACVDVPNNFIVDDFFLTMSVIEQGKFAINELDAIAYEDVSHVMTKEFTRKKRIAAGNFQNLNRFKHLLFPPTTGLAFSFWSHKVLRWKGPFFMLFALISNVLLLQESVVYEYLFAGQVIFWMIPLFDFVLGKLGIHNKLLRFVSHLFGMNLALLLGFFTYLGGVKTNVWTPTERNQ
tara:strand:+ start:655 stop:1827 length:1173 start_codon:yes stop_codon:yes gene_type:complete